ncbi:MAG: S24 family peptidase [Rhodobacteraceae bacterium]|nr:S24 family peptidase [Paracoccaceae bacterium]
MSDLSDIRRRAEMALGSRSATGVAGGAGLPRNAIWRFLRGNHEPKAGRLLEICAALGMEISVGPPERTSVGRSPAILAYPVEAAEIEGAATPSGCMLFTATFLRAFGLDPVQLLAVEIEDDEMRPLLVSGGCAVVDRRLTNPVEGGIYAFASDRPQPLLRRAVRDSDGNWNLVRDIPIHPSRPWPGNDECLGRVVWASRMEF